ncbi:hypothetical protein ABMA27_003247 [Loxostege sticticalis]|uniref:Protein sleepless n=1 Tax=Loxostege sticticalis TaxID=481309 RepID=A0ABR3H0C4_LOXSC
MTSTNKLLCTFFVLLSMVYKASSIQCYYCNSANNSACIDVKAFDDETRARIIPVVTCETAIPSPVAVDFFCRKIVQTIFHSHRDSEVRVTRGCGWVRHHKECYQANNQDHLETVCQCTSDYCNSAEAADPTSAAVLFIALATALYLYR